MSLITSLKRTGTRLIEKHPISWYLAWKLVYNLDFLLPHDQSYMAIRHFPGIDGSLLLDIGANNGISALSFNRVNPTLRFVSLEPNAIHRKSLERLKGRIRSFDYRMIGAGDSEGEIDLYTPVCFAVTLHTATSSDKERLPSWVEEQYGSLARKNTTIVHSRAPIATVDSLRLDPKIIKIDAEGFDYNVIVGAKETIARNRPFIITEACHDEDGTRLQTLMASLGYTLFSYDLERQAFRPVEDSGDGDLPGQRNAFAIPDEKIENLPVVSARETSSSLVDGA